MAWYPTALLDARSVTWAAIDRDHARATQRVGALAVSAIFEFGPDGLPLSVVGPAPYGSGGVADVDWYLSGLAIGLEDAGSIRGRRDVAARLRTVHIRALDGRLARVRLTGSCHTRAP